MSCAQDQKNEHPYTNELIHESSPYLLEHAHNPVNWYPWGDKAFQKAKQENKPMIISIGYAACHWCHVMERESFSDSAVARFMNDHFVAIKVDREERPDVDQIYINASQLITGGAGWPLNVFALPDGRPFYAGTYFPRSHWLQLLTKISELYIDDHERVVRNADDVLAGIKSQFAAGFSEESPFGMADYEKLYGTWKPSIDFQWGGFAYTPKFPLPTSWEFLMQYHFLTGNDDVLKGIRTTLDRMLMGGLYDQIGGGFARYSTDAHWLVPHFEKMLYDNGQLVSLYAHAYQLTRDSSYANAIRQTLAFIKRELSAPDGGFYSSLNADSEGEEGRFYVWSQDEVNQAVGEKEAGIISDYYSTSPSGNWEDGKNIFFRAVDDEAFAKKHELTDQALANLVARANEQLFEIRNKRIRPSTDDKILTSWNALMIQGYCDAYSALNERAYLEMAIANTNFLEKNLMKKDGSLMRSFKDGKASIPAFLDDYAFLSSALIRLYQVTFDIHWLEKARALTKYSIQHFRDDQSGMFYYTSNNAESLVARGLEIPDNVMPSSNSVTAHNLLLLGTYYDDSSYLDMARQMLASVMNDLEKGGQYYANWARLLGLIVSDPYEVAVMGRESVTASNRLQQNYLPTAFFLGGQEENLPLLEMKLVENKTIIYVCRNKVCKRPVTEAEEALQLMTR